MKAQESSAAAIVKRGERYVCEVLGLFSDALKEAKREFHEEHADMVRAVRDLAAEEIAI
ncbi:hypothetical protein [Paenibacillus helianthi]|uniref:hypothetical protein n=1 Tax=Paenibacillus helianthi TaxID=1349432 RepID=UPI000AFB9B7C|nr:hypothetical protein [Paenibacillus helianthi]